MTDPKKARFGRLTLIERINSRKWRMTCDCGAETVVWAGNVQAGRTTSCGCRQVECARALKNQTTHGMCGTPTYSSWAAMRARCLSTSAGNWEHYGGSGITVCDRWNSFENFLQDMGERPANKTLDRIDYSKGYEPGNCRWATNLEQANNKRGLHIIEHAGKRQSLAMWSRELAISASTINSRLRKGMSAAEALFKTEGKV